MTNILNGSVSITGFGTTAFSTKNCITTNNLGSRCCYIGGSIFGTFGMISSGLSCVNQVWQFNSLGFLVTRVNGVFLGLGNSLNAAGSVLEGKSQQARQQSRLAAGRANWKNSYKLLFTPIYPFESVSQAKIFKGTILIKEEKI